METCDMCKFWTEPNDDGYGDVPGVGRCKAVVQYWDAAEWDDDAEGRRLLPKFADKLAFVQDGSDYFAKLYTKSSFGCVQHENNYNK